MNSRKSGQGKPPGSFALTRIPPFRLFSSVPSRYASFLWTTLFFTTYLVVGLLAFDDYGLSWDESSNRRNGIISALYVNGMMGNPFLSQEDLRGYLHTYRESNDLPTTHVYRNHPHQ